MTDKPVARVPEETVDADEFAPLAIAALRELARGLEDPEIKVRVLELAQKRAGRIRALRRAWLVRTEAESAGNIEAVRVAYEDIYLSSYALRQCAEPDDG